MTFEVDDEEFQTLADLMDEETLRGDIVKCRIYWYQSLYVNVTYRSSQYLI
jgi:hypothetical protein